MGHSIPVAVKNIAVSEKSPFECMIHELSYQKAARHRMRNEGHLWSIEAASQMHLSFANDGEHPPQPLENSHSCCDKVHEHLWPSMSRFNAVRSGEVTGDGSLFGRETFII